MYISTQSKCTKQWKQSSATKWLLETLFFTITMCTGFSTDSLCMSTMCAVSLEPSQSISRSISSFKDSSA